jgi:hypothetical protein
MRTILTILLLFAIFASPKEASHGETCPDAPPSRLRIGERAEVAPGVDRLRLRVLPAVGTGEVGLLYAGNAFAVLAGPSCNGGLSWWRVELDSGTRGWVAEGTWSDYYLRPLDRRSCTGSDSPWFHFLTRFVCDLLGMGA